MSKEIVKIIPNCIDNIGKYTPAKHREIRKTTICTLPVAVLIILIRYIHKERMTNKQYEHEERILQMELEHEEKMLKMQYEHEEKIEEINANILTIAEDGKHEKDN